MPVEIRATTVTPNESGALVQLHISDATHPDAVAAISLTLAVQVPAFDAPMLAHYQREAISLAETALGELREKATAEIRRTRLDLKPKLRGAADHP
jgi:hypothetical protein